MFPKVLLLSGSATLLGMLSNLLCLIANHGKMPVFVCSQALMDPWHQIATPSTRLAVLADRFCFLNNWFYSVGDALIVSGFFIALVAFLIRWAVCAFNIDCKQVPWYDA